LSSQGDELEQAEPGVEAPPAPFEFKLQIPPLAPKPAEEVKELAKPLVVPTVFKVETAES